MQQNLFTFLLEGEKTVHYAGDQVTVQPHQLVMLSAGNCLMSEKIAKENAGYSSILIFFDNKLLSDFFNRHPLLLKSTERSCEQPFLLFEKDEFLVNFTRSLDYLLQAHKHVYYDLQKIKLEELFLYLAIQYPEQIRKLGSVSGETNDDFLVRQTVTANIDGNMTVEELAFLCNMSLSTFKRRFSRIYGSSPSKWLLEKRMSKAAKMLRQEGRKASEIYYELGYENLSSFIHSFKQVHGVTPKQYQLSN